MAPHASDAISLMSQLGQKRKSDRVNPESAVPTTADVPYPLNMRTTTLRQQATLKIVRLVAQSVSFASPEVEKGHERMGKLALVATIKTVPGKRDEYLKHLKAHAQRCLATEPGTLKFEILVPLHAVGDA
jgi:hypothetical protein